MPDFASSLEGPFELDKGPIVEIEVAVSSARERALLFEKRLVPQPVSTKAFLDTGSTGTAIDYRLMDKLSLPALDYTRYRTPGGLKFAPTCYPKLTIPTAPTPWSSD